MGPLIFLSSQLNRCNARLLRERSQFPRLSHAGRTKEGWEKFPRLLLNSRLAELDEYLTNSHVFNRVAITALLKQGK
jgi:hypothetical protein